MQVFMETLKVYVTNIHDPWFNLATEDWLFQEMSPDEEVLYLWRNAPTVVIGRYQNPWIECDLEAMEADGVLLSRRQSGGGAVYHDLGNTNFTFMSGRDSYSKNRNTQIIINALGRFGITASASGRNDIVVEGRKISGSAFKLSSRKAFHHGTLLIRADITHILKYLTPDKQKLAAKGIRSVASRVANLSEFSPGIDHQSLSEAVTTSFFEEYGSTCSIRYLDYETLKEIPHLREYYDMMKDWEWRFGRTPSFGHRISGRFDWGSLDVYIRAEKGRIREAVIHSDTLFPELVEHLKILLEGLPYDAGQVRELTGNLPGDLPFPRQSIMEAVSWIASEIQRSG